MHLQWRKLSPQSYYSPSALRLRVESSLYPQRIGMPSATPPITHTHPKQVEMEADYDSMTQSPLWMLPWAAQQCTAPYMGLVAKP